MCSEIQALFDSEMFTLNNTTQPNQDPHTQNVHRRQERDKKCPTQKNKKTEAGSQVWNAKTSRRIDKFCGVTGSRSSKKEEE
jgi:hypothetical protein